ncbi:hypothetical protein LCGC14_0477750 [marine sediment metagenome]|uniref:Uncharacterized protein n=1 Tax=marine sediment metagenome TaxID=412755 RepID=A0A0F9SFN7_9ZZZZ
MKILGFWWIWWGITIGFISGSFVYYFIKPFWGMLAFSLGLFVGSIFYIQDLRKFIKEKQRGDD